MELKVQLEKQKKQSKLLPDSQVGLVVEEAAAVGRKAARKKMQTGGPDCRRVTFLGTSGSSVCT